MADGTPEKCCRKCGSVKRLIDFNRDKYTKDGHDCYCRICRKKMWHDHYDDLRSRNAVNATRAWRERNPERYRTSNRAYTLKSRYGLTQQDWDQLLEKQGGTCVCGDPATDVDHDHKTGEVRGLLCHTCNSVLGYAKDSRNRLMKLAEYLRKSRRSVVSARS